MSEDKKKFTQPIIMSEEPSGDVKIKSTLKVGDKTYQTTEAQIQIRKLELPPRLEKIRTKRMTEKRKKKRMREK